MSLLQVLQLPPPPAQALRRPDAPAIRTPAAGADDAPAPRNPAAPGAPVGDMAALRAEAAAMRRRIEAARERARVNLKAAQALEPQLQARLATARGEAKAALAQQLETVRRKDAEAVAAIDQAEEDLATITSPGATPAQLTTLLARHGSRAQVAPVVSVQSVSGDSPLSRLNREVTTSSTSHVGGVARQHSVRDTTRLDGEGLHQSRREETVLQTREGTARQGEHTGTTLGLDGTLTREQGRTLEVEDGEGRRTSMEASRRTVVGRGGVSATQAATVTQADGSARARSHTLGVERGDGRLGATAGDARTHTSARGTATSHERRASAGLSSDAEGVGAQAKAERSVQRTSRKGRSAGAVAGLHAQLKCQVGEGRGEPPRYPVTLTISFGASLGGSAGAKKASHEASAGVQAKASVERTMVVEHQLDEAELADYLGALRQASAGQAVAASHREFAIITTGLQQNWDAARRLWEGGGALDASVTAALKHSGDSVSVSGSRTAEGSVDGQVKGIGLTLGGSTQSSHSTKVTRNDAGALDVDTEAGRAHRREAKLSVSLGAVGLEIGAHHEVKTSFGYSIVVDPATDPDGTLVQALGACRSDAQYQLLIAANPTRLKLISRTEAREEASGSAVGVGIGGVKLGLHGGESVAEKTTTDADGQLKERQVVGGSSLGGEIAGLADSQQEQAVAQHDGRGNASLTLTRTTKDNHNARSRAKAARRVKERLSSPAVPEHGLLAALGGAASGEDTGTRDVAGLTLKTAELRRVGGMACRSLGAWIGCCHRPDDLKDWIAAGQAVRAAKGDPGAVAEQLARFVGGDRVERLKVVERLFRGGHGQRAGKAFEFPDGLRSVRPDYERLTDDGLPDQMMALARHDAPAAVAECKRLLALGERVGRKIQACNEFGNASVKMEMLQELESCLDMFERAIRGFAKQDPDADPAVWQHRRDRLAAALQVYRGEQKRLRGKLDALLDGHPRFRVADGGEVRPLLKQLDELQYRWTSDFMRWQEAVGRSGGPIVDRPDLQPDKAMAEAYAKKVPGGW